MSAVLGVPLSPGGAALPAVRPARRLWASRIGVLVAAAVVVVLVPVLHLVVPDGNPFHLSEFAVGLIGKIMCYAIAALAMDLIWGYTGILSLGHGVFFALGGYAMGMYLMRQIGQRRQLQERADARLHGVPRLEDACPWHWTLSAFSFVAQMALVIVAGARPARLRVRLLRVPLAHQGRVLLDHHAGA